MGLPVWREPTVVEAATKSDKPAHARSAIRRHRVRGNPYAASAYRLANGVAPQGSEAAAPSPRRGLLFEVIRRPHRRVIAPEDDTSSESDAELDAVAQAADLARMEAANRRRTESGRALLRDALSYELPGRRLRDRPSDSSRNMPPPLPPVPESRDYARRQPWELAMERARLDELYRRRGRMASPTFVPTPPYTPGSGDASSRSSPHSQAITPPLGSAALTPGFPPAHRFSREPIQGPLANPEAYGVPSSRLRPDPNQADIDQLPPLRRMSRRIVDGPLSNSSERPEQQPHSPLVDGLGDRERSLSPEDPWEALLSTIPPDTHLPSSDSSFTSASASASFASGPASTSTSLATAPTSSAFDPYPGCDLLDSDSDASMTEAEDDELDHPNFSRLYDHPDDDYHPRSIPTGPPPNRGALRVPSATERRQIENMFREDMRMMMLGPEMPSIPVEWWESEGLLPPGAR
ncbi:hypothetical protein GP486_006399 [Trichoglossum hirsutum]|uniref:Uncharacterized protein n=1 Tax=Trichoglossum hirsutum TaxID=265104 RepID=A0A9P8IHB9_9PEZI|nr:hypothetical protein GP486_006399 [Trichoglossum hirsutum]